jgi:squalene cyclase
LVASYSLVDASKQKEIKQRLLTLCQFLLSKQSKEDDGWGESVESCRFKVWVPSESNVVNSSWALLALVQVYKLLGPSEEVKQALMKGAHFIVTQQSKEGDWIQPTSLAGVFNKTCGITYTSYRNTFPVWALGEVHPLALHK